MTPTPSSALAPCLALALLSCTASRRVHPRAAEEVSRGYAYLARGDLERAEIAFAHALEFNEDIPEALNGAGVVERSRGRLDAARTRFEHAVKAWPHFAEGHVNLGELELARGRDAAAEASFRAALRIDPDLAVARLDLARTLLHRGRGDPARRPAAWAQARREYLHLLESRDLPEAHHDLGFIAYESGELERALEAYTRAADAAPGYAEALHGRCISLARLGRLAEAERACRACLDAAPASERCAASLRAVASGAPSLAPGPGAGRPLEARRAAPVGPGGAPDGGRR